MPDVAATIDATEKRRSNHPTGRLPAGRGDRLIAPMVNLLGVVLVGLVALYLGGALHSEVTERAVALAGLGAVVLVLIAAPDLGLLFWMLLAPFGTLFNLAQGSGLPDLSLNRIASAVLVWVLIAQVASGRRKLARLTAVEGWGILFVLALIMSIGTSRLGWIWGIQVVFDAVVVPLLCFYLARNLFTDRRQLVWLAVLFAVLGATLGIITVREQLTNQAILSPLPYRMSYGQHSIKVTSLFGAPAAMAMTLAVTLPIVFVAATRSSRLGARLGWLAALLAIGGGLIATYVRAGWLAAVAGIVVVVVVSRRARPAGLLLLLIVLFAALIFSGGLADTQAIEERLQSEGSIIYRLQALSTGLDIAAESPWWGLGLDNYSDAAAAAGWQPRRSNATLAIAPHNMFIYVLTSAGIVALVPFVAQLVAAGWRGWRTLRRSRTDGASVHATGASDGDWAAAAIAMLVGYVLVISTFDSITAQFATILFWMSLGALFGATGGRQLDRQGPTHVLQRAVHEEEGL